MHPENQDEKLYTDTFSDFELNSLALAARCREFNGQMPGANTLVCPGD